MTGEFHKTYPKLPWRERIKVGVRRFGYAWLSQDEIKANKVNVKAFAAANEFKTTEGSMGVTFLPTKKISPYVWGTRVKTAAEIF